MNRDEIVEIYEVDQFSFNDEWYSEIHLSITHINFDKNGNRRNHLEVEQVIETYIYCKKWKKVQSRILYRKRKSPYSLNHVISKEVIMRIKKVGTRTLTKDEILLDKAVKLKLKNKKFGSVGLLPNANEIEKMKFSIARDIVIFKLKSEISQSEMAKIMGVSKSRVSEILHYRLSKYSLDTLIKYLFALKGHVKETDKRIEVITELFNIAA